MSGLFPGATEAALVVGAVSLHWAGYGRDLIWRPYPARIRNAFKRGTGAESFLVKSVAGRVMAGVVWACFSAVATAAMLVLLADAPSPMVTTGPCTLGQRYGRALLFFCLQAFPFNWLWSLFTFGRTSSRVPSVIGLAMGAAGLVCGIAALAHAASCDVTAAAVLIGIYQAGVALGLVAHCRMLALGSRQPRAGAAAPPKFTLM